MMCMMMYIHGGTTNQNWNRKLWGARNVLCLQSRCAMRQPDHFEAF